MIPLPGEITKQSRMRDDFSSNLIEKLGELPEHDILSREKDGRYFAALSPERVNAVEWFPFGKEESLLQYGAESGAFLSLAEKTACWDILDPEQSALDVVRARMKSRKQFGDISSIGDAVSIGDASAESTSGSGDASRVNLFTAVPDTHYDILFLADWPGSEKAKELIAAVRPERVLVLAENASALKFVSGAEKDPKKRYASAEELEQLAEGSGAVKLYYPLPSAAFAKDIYSDTLLPGPGSFRGVSDDLTDSRTVSCDEEALYDSLTAADPNMVRRYAPAFLCVIGADELPDYIRYNSTRKEELTIRTDLYLGKKVTKTALSPKAKRHIAAFKERYELLAGCVPEGVEVLKPEMIGGSAVFPFVEGKSFGKQLAEQITEGKAPAEQIETAIIRMIGKEGERKQHNLDILFDNILEKDGRLQLIDYEWTSEEPLSYRFVRYRILRYFYEDNAQTLTACGSLAEFLSAFGFSKDEQRMFEKQEEEFQRSVFEGGSRDQRDRFKKDASSVSAIREEARRMYADEIDELKTALKKEREVERLSQQHIRNIENINKARDAEVTALKAEVNWLQGHISLTSKAKRRLIHKLDAWAPADSKKRLVIKYVKGTLRHPGVYLKRYLTRDGHNYIRGNFAIRGEFSEGGILELPQAADAKPLVSIVIPAYNQVGYTYACIRSIIEHTDFNSTPYEVILADDASKDATSEITNWIHGLKVARTEGNLGFLRNCNNAAKEARGEYIFFLNNDTKVTDGWLSSLIALMERDESIGMCGSKLVYPDGRLQEAGGIIWSDASGWNYGRMDDPARYCYNYVKDVDYISGAAILIRTPLWKEIGGFDERFAPAYCEDSDLAFEVRRHGKRVVYQPASVVIHFEGVSNGTDVNGTGLKRYQVVNQEKFKEKWAEELAKQSENTGSPNPFAARERSQAKKTILVIDHYVPHHDADAGSKTTWQYLQMFVKKGYNVKFLGDNFRHDEPYATELEQLGIEVLWGDEIRETVFDWIEKNREFIDIAYLNRPHIAVKYIDFLKENTSVRCIYYGHDLHYLRIRREYELTGDIRKRRESDYWKAIEYQVMEKADMVYYPSQDEINEIHARRPEIPAKAITAYIYDSQQGRSLLDENSRQGRSLLTENSQQGRSLLDENSQQGRSLLTENSQQGRSFPAKAPGRTENTSGLLFVGGFKHPPNADGVLWFASEIWPHVRKELPEAEFFVAGSHPTGEVEALNGKDGIHVLGFVSDEVLEEKYRTTRLTVVPLRYGAGVKGKVVEALHLGCAIVTTSVGAEGIPEAETAMKIADTAETFAAAVIRAYNDEAELARMREAAAPIIKNYYSTEAAWSIIAPDFM